MSPRVDRAGAYQRAARNCAAYDEADRDWRVEFIQPAIPGDDRCIMLYGREGEIVGPLTMQLAEAWIDQFDSARYGTMLRERLSTPSGTGG